MYVCACVWGCVGGVVEALALSIRLLNGPQAPGYSPGLDCTFCLWPFPLMSAGCYTAIVCERERESESVCVCVCERERNCVCVKERVCV